MNFQVLLIILVVHASRAAGRWMRLRGAHWILLFGFIFTTAGILLAQPLGAPPVPAGYETAPIVDPFEKAKMQEAAHEETERYRMRVSLPQSAFAPRPDPRSSRGADHGRAADNSWGSGPRDLTLLLLKFLCIPVGAILWYRIAQKIAPEVAESMASWVGLRALAPAGAGGNMVTILAE
jgi:hypothetical protein